MAHLRCALVETIAELEVALAIRHRVFVEEQGVAPELEVDEFDRLGRGTLHAVAYWGDRGIAAGRLRPIAPGTSKLERLAVTASERGSGVGRSLTCFFENVAKYQGLSRLTLHAQDSARGFYEKLGYVANGAPFEEAGIGHIAMSKDLR